jgi:hypothetical protein
MDGQPFISLFFAIPLKQAVLGSDVFLFGSLGADPSRGGVGTAQRVLGQHQVSDMSQVLLL